MRNGVARAENVREAAGGPIERPKKVAAEVGRDALVSDDAKRSTDLSGSLSRQFGIHKSCSGNNVNSGGPSQSPAQRYENGKPAWDSQKENSLEPVLIFGDHRGACPPRRSSTRSRTCQGT